MDPGFALYIHWPFCLSKCPYCDFNSHVADHIDHTRWRDALLAELDHYGTETAGRKLTSVFFGGGTPSLMEADTIEALLGKLDTYWSRDENLEITLEANPTSIEAGRFRDFKAAGVNRVSIGVQSFDDTALGYLGREHSAREAMAALELADEIFSRFSFDLIYALPDQTAEGWRNELEGTLKLGGDHMSLYQLTIEPGTPFFRDGRKTLDEDHAADLFEITREIMEPAGKPAYEISNHACPGGECRHNLTYWLGGDYVGIGPGAHGRLTQSGQTTATHQIHNPGSWLESVTNKGHGTAKRRPLAPQIRAQELVMMGLRLTKGLEISRFEQQSVCRFETVVDAGGLTQMIDGGFLEQTGDTLRTTPNGRLCLNAVLGRLLG